jgi:hypothetical protein
MHRLTLLLGTLVICAMALYPPWSVERYEKMQHRLDRQIRVEGHPDPAPRSEHTSTVSTYRPAWSATEWTDKFDQVEFTGRIDTGRLLVQIVVVAFVTAVVAYLIGPRTSA